MASCTLRSPLSEIEMDGFFVEVDFFVSHNMQRTAEGRTCLAKTAQHVALRSENSVGLCMVLGWGSTSTKHDQRLVKTTSYQCKRHFRSIKILMWGSCTWLWVLALFSWFLTPPPPYMILPFSKGAF